VEGDRFLEDKLQKRESGFEPVLFVSGHRIDRDARLQFHTRE
jgi:hypothetical protein